MIYLSSISSLALIWFLVVTIPGPNFIVVTRVSITQSKENALFITLGVSIGAGIWAAASLLGLNVLFKHAAWLYETLKIIGGCYLVYMGVRIIVSAFRHSDFNDVCKEKIYSRRNAFQKGLLTSFSNPKTAAFFGSLFLSAFPAQMPFWFYPIMILVIIGVSIFWYGVVAYFFSFDKVRMVYKRARQVLDILTGSLLSYWGGRLVFN